MYTRRSPRNQEILFKALFKAPEKAKAPLRIRTDAEIDAIPLLSMRTRNMLKRDAQRQRMHAARRSALAKVPS